MYLKVGNGEDVHISKTYVAVHFKVLLWNVDDPELLTCFYGKLACSQMN